MTRRPQWGDCKVCGGDHWTRDHITPVRFRVAVTVIGTNLVMDYGTKEAAIAALEAMEARTVLVSEGLDVERLARALEAVDLRWLGWIWVWSNEPGRATAVTNAAERVAAEYAALAESAS